MRAAWAPWRVAGGRTFATVPQLTTSGTCSRCQIGVGVDSLVLFLEYSQNSSVTRSWSCQMQVHAPLPGTVTPQMQSITANNVPSASRALTETSRSSSPVCRLPSLGSRRRWRDEGRSEPSPAVPRLTRRTTGQCQWQRSFFFLVGLSPFSILPKCGRMQGGCRDANTLGSGAAGRGDGK
jgi:hypothetical protein